MRPSCDPAPLIGSARVVLGPMAGVTDAPFRAICKRMGAGLAYTEMVSARGLHYDPDAPASRALLTFAPEETPVAVQLFGSDPQMMAEQAARLCKCHGDAIALIDVNMGCPVAKIVRKGEGCALMRYPGRAAAIVRAIAEAVDVPVTAKFRKGWSEAEANAVEFALALEEAGASALAVHGRTREQFYGGRACRGTGRIRRRTRVHAHAKTRGVVHAQAAWRRTAPQARQPRAKPCGADGASGGVSAVDSG